jgi:ActR/RegA family two-component response regulator
MSVRDRGGRAAQMRAERVRWRGRSRSMSQASRNMSEHLRRMNVQASALDMRLQSSRGEQRELAREVGRPPRLD